MAFTPITGGGSFTRRNIEEGENVMVGTMNNAGTVLLTVADMSVIEAEVEVDETDIPLVQMGQKAKVTIDAIPDKEFTGTVTEIGNSPIQTAGTGTTPSPKDPGPPAWGWDRFRPEAKIRPRSPPGGRPPYSA